METRLSGATEPLPQRTRAEQSSSEGELTGSMFAIFADQYPLKRSFFVATGEFGCYLSVVLFIAIISRYHPRSPSVFLITIGPLFRLVSAAARYRYPSELEPNKVRARVS
jgi:hypothetical protein